MKWWETGCGISSHIDVDDVSQYVAIFVVVNISIACSVSEQVSLC